jgi:conjugal transfer mating pair stabilization protein TraN
MRVLILLAFLLFSSLSAAEKAEMKKYQNDAKAFAKEGSKNTIEQIQNNTFDELKRKEGGSFDQNSAKNQLTADNIEKTDIVNYLQSDEVQKNLRDNRRLSENEYFIAKADEMIAGAVIDTPENTMQKYHFETCQESAEPYPVSLTRTLQVEVDFEPETPTKVKKCTGHKKKKKFFWKNDAKEWCKDKKEELSLDPHIKYYDVDWHGSVTSGYTAKAEWRHLDNVSSCDEFVINEENESAKLKEKEEKWIYDSEDYLSIINSPQCTLIEKVCLDASPKIIKGAEIQKQCWKEKVNFLCHFPHSKQCASIRDKNCQEFKRRCLKESPYGCALWEITYKCFDKIYRSASSNSQGEFFEVDVDKEYEPNQSFSAVITKMQIFDEIKQQLEIQNPADASKVHLFNGKKLKCSKSVAGKLLYDCCFTFGGLATELKLSQCSEEEQELGTLREKELCHYVGKYEEQFIDLWKSRDMHVFCCFPSKLARIFQEEARSQIGLDWGTPKKPDCRGLLAGEIAKVDFSKLDLAEVYDKKIQEIEQKLKNKLHTIQQDLKIEHVQETRHIEARLKQKLNAYELTNKGGVDENG